MLSQEKKFLFIHVAKVAGRSIKASLKPYCDNLNVLQKAINWTDRLVHSNVPGKGLFPPARLFIDNRLPLRTHATALEYMSWLGRDDFSKYYKFTFVRNPFDRQVSLYEFIRQSRNHRLKETLLKMTFDEYLKWRCSGQFPYQSTYIFDRSGNSPLVDFIGKFENLNADFETIANKFSLEVKLGYVGKTKERKDWRTYYTPETQKLVVDTYAIDFDNFSYSREI